MYSHEIAELLKLRGYVLDVKEYFNVCETSPQITRVTYNPYDDKITILTSDKYDFKFKVKRKGNNNDRRWLLMEDEIIEVVGDDKEVIEEKEEGVE